MGNKKFTFKQLLASKKVEIPVLQRDYVHGNLKDKKAENIREDFVADLVNHLLQSHPDEMTLDFIYGKIIDDDLSEEQERREEHLESLLDTVSEYAKKSGYEIQKNYKRLNEFVSKDTFIPFDGQQRLTTLFLLHFLVYTKLDKDISFLSNFLYKTRESSRDFLEALLQNASDFTPNEIWESSFVTYIKDRNWFYHFWRYDPTVLSMMVMLEEFRKKVTQQDDVQDSIATMYANLENNGILTFDFLDIDEHQLDDILYVKMNASGKELTDFEKFKSWLIEYVNDKKNKIFLAEKDWEIKLDTVWYDLFWEVDTSKTDELLYQYIRKMLILRYCSNEIAVSDEDEKQKIQKTRKSVYDKLNGKDSISFRFYVEHNLIDEDSLNFIWWNLNILCHDTKYNRFEAVIRKIWNRTFLADWKEEEPFRYFLIKNLGNFNLFHQTFLFSIFIYIEQLNKSSENFSEENFFDWMRLSRNLIYNSRIDDTTPFFSAIQSLKNFGNRCLDVKAVLTSASFIDYFPERQRKEEFRKNKPEYDSWRDSFVVAENHSYFYGQIAFLIELSKVDGVPNLEKFKNYYSILSEIFSSSNLEGKHLISMSLLTIDDKWMPDLGSNRYLFCLPRKATARDRDENWRRIFNDKSKRAVLEELIKLYMQYGDLDSLIAERKVGITDWRRLLLEYPEELDYCKQGLINWVKGKNYVRLLGQSRLSHYHRELRTSVLFNTLLKKAFNLSSNDYGEMKSDDVCYINFNLNNNQLRIRFDYNELALKVFKVEDEIERLVSEEKISDIDEKLRGIINSFEIYNTEAKC